MKNKKGTTSKKYHILIVSILFVIGFCSSWAQPRGKFIYSGSYDYNGRQVPKQTNYNTLFVTPYQSANQTWLKVKGITQSGQQYNLPSNSGRYVFRKYKSGLSLYDWEEQCLIVESNQTVIQFYRDVTTGKYDEFIYFGN